MTAPKSSRKPRRVSKRGAGTCFAIMPFGGWFDQYWERIYCPAIDAAGLVAERADDVFRPGSIMRDIWDSTRRARVLVADLTTRNSNVFYELGLAHAIAKPVILISESIEDVPFDLQGLRLLLYDQKEPAWGSRLRKDLAKALRETLASPAAAIPSPFIEAPNEPTQPKLSSTERELLQLRQDLEQLRRQVQYGGLDPERILSKGFTSVVGEHTYSVMHRGSYERETPIRPASLTELDALDRDDER